MLYPSHIMHALEENMPNYWPYIDQICYAHCDVQKAFPMSPEIIPSTFFTDIININLTDMSLMFNYYVVCSDDSTTFPLTTGLALCLKYCCLISNIIRIVAHCQTSLFSNSFFGG